MAWFGVGISEAGLKGFDFNIAIRGAQAQTWTMGDYFSVNENPELDDKQNALLEVAPAFDKANRTTAVFSRRFETCDPQDVAITYNSERSLTWAFGYGDWLKAKANFFNATHGAVLGIKFWPNPNDTFTMPSNNANMSLVMPGFPVPAANASLACTNFKLPNDTAYQSIRYEGFAASPLVHHMNVYACGAGVVPAAEAGSVYDCSKALPVGCETLQFMWGPGAVPFSAPPQAGFNFGAGGAGFYVLQVHYQNPKGLKMADASGFNVTYTNQPRSNALGVLTLGTYDINVPPGQERFSVAPNYCPANCTGARVQAPVTLVSNFFIMGARGAQVWTRHVRNGSALQPLGQRTYFDSRYTGFQQVPTSTNQLLPNDTLITICTFNTSADVKYNTSYGLTPSQEICFNYVTFYPVAAMPGLDSCVANTKKNVSTCATRTRIAAATAANLTDVQQLRNGTVVLFRTAPVALWKSAFCKQQEGGGDKPTPVYNTKGAIASIFVVIIVLVSVGLVLYFKYQRKEEMEALLAEIRKAELS